MWSMCIVRNKIEIKIVNCAKEIYACQNKTQSLPQINSYSNKVIKLVFQYKADDVEYTMTQYETIVGPVSFQFNCTYKCDLSNDYESILNSIISTIEFKADVI